MEVWFFLSALNISGKPYLRKRYPSPLIMWFSFLYNYLKLSSWVVIFPILSGNSLLLDFFHSHSVSFPRTFLILKKINEGFFEAVHKLFDEISP